MSVIAILLPLALLMAAGAVVAFIQSARRGEMDDLDSPPIRVLNDD